VAREVPGYLRSYTFPPLELALLTNWDEKLDHLARASLSLPITLIAGVPSWLLVLFERLCRLTGKKGLTEIWPTLQVVLHGGTRFDPYQDLFRRLVGDGVAFQDLYAASEGFIAAEDPRHGLLRLIPDHGIFFEFVPLEEMGKTRPTRHTAADIVPGIQYAVILTTCAGLWSYILGDTICFERCEPPLLRFTGRTRQFLSAFGEHLIGEEVEQAVASAARTTGAEIFDFHVGPLFPRANGLPGRHRYLIEFAREPADLDTFARALDDSLCQSNEDYRSHRTGDLTMLTPEVVVVPCGGFATWMRSCGKLGGQHKVPRLASDGRLTADLFQFFERTYLARSVVE
jgi:hypothetical protein